jgi:hypothetical protein
MSAFANSELMSSSSAYVFILHHIAQDGLRRSDTDLLGKLANEQRTLLRFVQGSEQIVRNSFSRSIFRKNKEETTMPHCSDQLQLRQ